MGKFCYTRSEWLLFQARKKERFSVSGMKMFIFYSSDNVSRLKLYNEKQCNIVRRFILIRWLDAFHSFCHWLGKISARQVDGNSFHNHKEDNRILICSCGWRYLLLSFFFCVSFEWIFRGRAFSLSAEFVLNSLFAMLRNIVFRN